LWSFQDEAKSTQPLLREEKKAAGLRERQARGIVPVLKKIKTKGERRKTGGTRVKNMNKDERDA